MKKVLMIALRVIFAISPSYAFASPDFESFTNTVIYIDDEPTTIRALLKITNETAEITNDGSKVCLSCLSKPDKTVTMEKFLQVEKRKRRQTTRSYSSSHKTTVRHPVMYICQTCWKIVKGTELSKHYIKTGHTKFSRMR